MNGFGVQFIGTRNTIQLDNEHLFMPFLPVPNVFSLYMQLIRPVKYPNDKFIDDFLFVRSIIFIVVFGVRHTREKSIILKKIKMIYEITGSCEQLLLTEQWNRVLSIFFSSMICAKSLLNEYQFLKWVSFVNDLTLKFFLDRYV